MAKDTPNNRNIMRKRGWRVNVWEVAPGAWRYAVQGPKYSADGQEDNPEMAEQIAWSYALQYLKEDH